MATTYVIIDLETTGLDAQSDGIIEVAAITLEGNDILDEYASLVNPHQDIPEHIVNLTGITEEMVADAPSMFALRSRLRRVLGDNVLVGHNVDFDLNFLRAESLALGNHRLDTMILASILVPDAPRYKLETLSQYLNLPRPEAGQIHRALDDVEQTVELFLALQERALALDRGQLEEIVEAGRRLGWPETLFFEEALAQKARVAFQGPQVPVKRSSGRRLAPLYHAPQLNGRAPVAAEEPDPIDIDMVAGMIRPGGHFSRVFPGFEYRPQQVEMLETVATAFNEGQHVLVEAGTGTGKSVGYLLPAAFWANENGRRVVISTNTINLQDQLINKDIPQLQKLLPFEVRAAVRKGRRNYLCTRLFQQMRHSGPSSADEMVLFARILLWLPHTETGDLAELTLRTVGERLAWSRLSGENASCTGDHCAQEHCPLYMARRQAELAHLVVVNHSLLLSDVASNNRILPDYWDLVVDEAHHLEAAVTDGLSFRADKRFLEVILDEVLKPRAGLIATVVSRTQSLPQDISSKFSQYTEQMRREAQSAKISLDEFFTTLRYFLKDHFRQPSQFAQQLRLVDAVRTQPDYSDVEITWDNLNRSLKGVSAGFINLAEGLAEVAENVEDVDEGEALRVALMSNGRSLEETSHHLNAIVAEPQADIIYWVERFKERISLHAAPLHVGPLVEEHIFGAKETVILTSATMRTAASGSRGGADFNYIRDRLHAGEAHEMAVGSPFDYKDSTLLYLVTDIPEPNQPGYERYLESAIVDVAHALGGRTMVLFTSYSQLTRVSKAIEGKLAEANIVALAQSQGTSRQQLLDQFKQEGSRAVLLGTRSFWEGVDVPGPALQALLITKFPFDVPSDPIFAARSETFENAFFEYSIPEAVLRFRQGFGRLVRRKTDEGIVVVLDKRILTKRYGRMFLESLPECTVLRQRSSRLAELTLRWLNRDKS